MSIGDFPESWSQAILVGVMLVGRLGVAHRNSQEWASIGELPPEVSARIHWRSEHRRKGKCSWGGSDTYDICWSPVKTTLVKCPSVQWQPDGWWFDNPHQQVVPRRRFHNDLRGVDFRCAILLLLLLLLLLLWIMLLWILLLVLWLPMNY